MAVANLVLFISDTKVGEILNVTNFITIKIYFFNQQILKLHAVFTNELFTDLFFLLHIIEQQKE